MGPWNDTGTNRNDHCIKRSLNPSVSKRFLGPAAVQNSLAQTTFDDFIPLFEGIRNTSTQLGQHRGGHLAVGGTVWGSSYFSPPLRSLVQDPFNATSTKTALGIL